MPEEPPNSAVVFPAPATADERGRVTVGGDLEPGTILAAYRSGLFPMRQPTGELTWWSPDPRGVLTPGTLRVSPSLRRSQRRFDIRVDTAFAAVLDACADRGPGEYEWITAEITHAFLTLHELGWAHSVEAWSLPAADDPPELVGGLYGVAIGGLFAGESMFYRRTDASKAALVALVELLHEAGAEDDRFIDVQWLTPHLSSLGAFEISRAEYLDRLERAIALPLPAAFAGAPSHARRGGLAVVPSGRRARTRPATFLRRGLVTDGDQRHLHIERGISRPRLPPLGRAGRPGGCSDRPRGP